MYLSDPKSVMMKTLYLYLLLIFSFSTPLLSYGQWQQSAGLDGANITYMVSADSVLLATSEHHGIFTKKGNDNWQSCQNTYPYRRLFNAGACVFATTAFFIDFPSRSFDGGITWEEMRDIGSATYMAAIDTVLFHGTGYSLRSFDFGDSFDTIVFPYPLDDNYSTSFVCDTFLYIHYYDFDGYNEIFYSANYGETWKTLILDGLFTNPYMTLDNIKYLAGTFWAETGFGTAPRGLSVLNTQTNTWKRTSNELPGRGILDMFEYNNKVLMSIDKHPVYCYVSYDSLWNEFASPQKYVHSFLIHNNDLYCATKQGASSLDTLGNYIDYNEGLNHRTITSISSYDNKVLVAANNEIYMSLDGGSSFTKLENAYGFQIIATDSVYYTVSEHDFRLSRDEGETWKSYHNWIRCPSGSSFTHLSITNKYYFLGTMKGLYRTIPNPINWVKLEEGPFFSDFWVSNVEAIGRSVIAGEYLFAQKMYMSNNFGINFSDYGSYCGLCKIDQTYFLLKDSIHISNDQAETWESLRLSNNTRANCIDRKGDTLVVAGRDDYGHIIVEMCNEHTGYWNWIDIIDDLPDVPYDENTITEIKIYDGRILIANPLYGCWYRDDILTGIDDNEIDYNDIPDVKIFPNPVSNNAALSYILHKDGIVNLRIYNQYGCLVDEIKEYQSAGKNQIVWNINNNVSGMYFYQAAINSTTISGRFIICGN